MDRLFSLLKLIVAVHHSLHIMPVFCYPGPLPGGTILPTFGSVLNNAEPVFDIAVIDSEICQTFSGQRD